MPVSPSLAETRRFAEGSEHEHWPSSFHCPHSVYSIVIQLLGPESSQIKTRLHPHSRQLPIPASDGTGKVSNQIQAFRVITNSVSNINCIEGAVANIQLNSANVLAESRYEHCCSIQLQRIAHKLFDWLILR